MIRLAVGASGNEEGAVGRMQRPRRQRIASQAVTAIQPDQADQSGLRPVPGQGRMRVDKPGQLVQIFEASRTDTGQQRRPAIRTKRHLGNGLAKMVADLRAVFAKHQRIMDHLAVAADHPAKPQPLHAENLRHAAGGNAAFIDTCNRRHPLSCPFQPGIHLVNDKPDVVPASNLGKARQLAAIHQPAGRVVRIGDEDHARARRDHGLQRIERELPPGFFIAIDNPDFGTGGTGQHLGLRPAGTLDDDLVTSAKTLAKCQIVGLGRAGCDQHVIGLTDPLKTGLFQHVLAKGRQALKRHPVPVKCQIRVKVINEIPKCERLCLAEAKKGLRLGGHGLQQIFKQCLGANLVHPAPSLMVPFGCHGSGKSYRQVPGVDPIILARQRLTTSTPARQSQGDDKITKIAVVTGAGGGMGQAICHRLMEDGFSVVGLDMNWPDGTVFDGPGFRAVTGDLADDATVAAIFDEIGRREGRIDVLVNNAGTCFMSDFPDIPAEEFRRQMAVNFESCFHCCQAAIPLMRGGEGVRKIVNISSNGAYNFDVFDPPHYRASKAAMDTLTKDLARRYASEKIAVNSIAPAMTQTPLFNVLTEETLEKAISAMPHGTAMQPDQIAAWVAFLAGPGGDVCSGNVIILNQGRDVR